MDVDLNQDEDAGLLQELAARGVELAKLEGRVVLRFSGAVQIGKLSVPYRLVPARGVLAKPSKWRRFDTEARAALIAERATDADIAELATEVTAFVRNLVEEADDYGVDPAPFLATLSEFDSAEPAEYVFHRIQQRLLHAFEREQEERHAARTKESINLAEYPASFEVASRIRRKFVALLGPTNSGKTHRAMEHLTQAGSGVYLAPLRLLSRRRARTASRWQ
jgi:ATP-dependent RNA helicase SUPV3L1/SUV3